MRRLKGGIIGAGKNSFIGFVHMAAARLFNESEIVSGVFSRDPERSRARGKELGIAEDRIYTSFEEMAQKEALRPPSERLDFVIIASPNSSHYEISLAFLNHGIHVFCDKPMAVSLKQGEEIRRVSKEKKLLFALTHGYTGYAMTKQARHLVESGELGRIHRVVVEYTQGWLSSLIENPEDFDTWHLDSFISGPSCTMMDVGIHALNLIQTITGRRPHKVCADLDAAIPGNELDDHGSVLLRFDDGTAGLLHASQVSSGEGNALRIRLYGSRGGLSWDQEYPETLERLNPDGTSTIYKKGNTSLCSDALKASRLPGGHPEGLISAFANIYRAGFGYIRGEKGILPGRDFPDAQQGLTGLAFIEAILASNLSTEKWTEVKSFEVG